MADYLGDTSGSKSFFGAIKGKLSRSSSKASSRSNHSTRGRSVSPAFGAKPSSNPIPFDAPPSYSVLPPNPQPAQRRQPSPSPSTASRLTTASITRPDDPYAFLAQFDTILVIDDSASMTGRNWNEVKALLDSIVPICTAHDPDGIDIYFLNHRALPTPGASRFSPATIGLGSGNSRVNDGGYHNITDISQVDHIMRTVRPSGATPTGATLDRVLKPYIRDFERRASSGAADPEATGLRPVNIIVVTDGCPTDDPESVIYDHALRLDKADAPRAQVGIQFFQVGTDSDAAKHLQQMDDNISRCGGGRAVRDMVDTVSWNARDGMRPCLTADAVLKVVLGAVIKRLDFQSLEEERRHLRV